MRIEIQNEPPAEILAEDLPEDVLAVVTSWPIGGYVGSVIQRTGTDRVCVIGDSSWWSAESLSKEHRCRVLPPGTLLKIV